MIFMALYSSMACPGKTAKPGKPFKTDDGNDSDSDLRELQATWLETREQQLGLVSFTKGAGTKKPTAKPARKQQKGTLKQDQQASDVPTIASWLYFRFVIPK